jgi:hypothetical protein
MTVSISPSPVSGSGSGAVVQTPSVTATPSGGLAPYTYSWSVVSSVGSAHIASPATASTILSMTGLSVGDNSGSAQFRCTVTDSLGATASATVNATFTYTGA